MRLGQRRVRNVSVWQEGQPCIDDYDCSHAYGGDDYCDSRSGTCVACRNSADCEHLGNGTTGVSCLLGDAGPARCGCTSDEGCAGLGIGNHCDTTASDPGYGNCGCRTTADCPAGEVCGGQSRCSAASVTCHTDQDCQSGFFCAPDGACRPRCDPGHACQVPDLLCDTTNSLGENKASDVWCFQCLQGSDCPEGQGCGQNTHVCGACAYDGECRASEYCTSNRTCQLSCDAGVCPAGWVCDTEDVAGTGYSTCYQCLNAADCPGDQGCNPYTHTCGSCVYPRYGYDLFSDCPPDAICSTFWSGLGVFSSGVCLPNCDRLSCPADKPICAVLPALTPDHSYCFGCLTDADCAEAGPGAWCDVSVNMTFACQPP